MSDRKNLLSRGYYVPTGVETAFLGLSARAHDCLILIKHKQGESGEAFPGQVWLAEKLKKSVRTIQRAIAELVEKGALVIRRTGRTNRYRVIDGECTVPQMRSMLGARVGSEATPRVGSEATHPGGSIEEEPEKKNQAVNTPSLREGAESQEEPEMPSKHQHQHQRHSDDDLDPVTALGLWEPQQDQLFPSPSRQPRDRTQAQQDTPYALACELDRQLSGKTWAGPSPVNRKAVASNFSRWKKDGVTAEQIRQMVSAYADDSTPHDPKVVPWKEFLARRRALYAQVERLARASAMEEHRYDAAYWLGDLAGR